MNQPSDRTLRLVGVAEATAVFLFFYQALRVLFSVLFGVIYDALFAGIVSLVTVALLMILVIAALLAPLAVPRKPNIRRIALLVGVVLVFLARIPMTVNEPQIRLAAAVVIVAATGLYLASRLRGDRGTVARPLILALVVDQLLRAAGHTWDVTLRPEWVWGQVAVSLILCLLAGWLFRQRSGEEQDQHAYPGLLGGLAWGAWLFLETSLLAFPNALARWSGAPYSIVAPLLLGVTLLPLLEGSQRPAPWRWWTGAIQLLVVVGGLALGKLLAGSVASLLALLLAQWFTLRLLPAILAPSRDLQPSRMKLALALGNTLFLILSFAYAFAFTYPYTLALFRGLGLPIILIAGLLVTLPTLRQPGEVEPDAPFFGRSWALLLGAVALVVLVNVLASPPTVPERPARATLRAATYNIHYGYDTDWHLSLDLQASTIEASGADLVALQEVDTGRPTSYMIDNALWLAYRLGMEVVYLPCVEHLTGIALLSRYSIVDAEALLLPSELEQTGIIWAQVEPAGTPINGFAIWMGLEPEERARQLEAALPFIDSHPGPAAFGGDFNSTPDSPVYARISDSGFVDPFVALGLGSPPTDPAIDPRERIDFVWLRDLLPLDARVLESTASDHRLVVAEAARP
jgi:endonuclease/exonuclease/phosphatase family metal-dependent hydrolase